MKNEDDAEVILLDLLNSTPVVDDRPTDALGREWLRAHGASGRRLADVRRLRDDLQRVVRGDARADVLTPHVERVTQTPVIVDGAVEWQLDADWAARVVLAWGALQATAPGRLRACANGECHLFLLDRSRAGTARWCSMEVCGNRMKARRHYGRARG